MFGFLKADKNGNAISLVALMSCFYFACMPLSVVPIAGMSLLKLITFGVAAGLLAALVLGKNELRLNIVHLMLVLYLIYSISSLFLLRDENAWINLRGIIETTLIFTLITSRIYNEREKRWLLNAWLAVGVISVLLMLLGGGVELGDESGRVTMGFWGGVEDANQLCGYFILPLLICLQRMINRGTKLYQRVFYIILTLAMIYVVFTTGSRGGLVAVIGAAGAYVLLSAKGIWNKVKIVVVTVLVGAIAFAVLFPLLPESVTERYSLETVEEDRGSGRFEIWGVVLAAIKENNVSMVFGHGIGSTGPILAAAGITNNVAHNHWLQIWCDQGMIGMILFFLILVAGYFKALRRNNIVSMAILGMVALSMSLTLYADYKAFWNVLMMSALNYTEVGRVGEG